MGLSHLGAFYARFMDDILVLAATRWKLRRAVKRVNAQLASLGLGEHPREDVHRAGREGVWFSYKGQFVRAPMRLSNVTTIHVAALACTVIQVLAGCEASPSAYAVPAFANAHESGPSLAPSPPTTGKTPVRADLQTMIAAAREDAASRTGMPAEAIEVLRAERVTWSDGSLGCPSPGMLYTQALVPGFRVMLDAGGEVLDYHLGSSGHLVLCPAGRAVEPRVDDRF